MEVTIDFVSEEMLDDCVEWYLVFKFKIGLLEHNFCVTDPQRIPLEEWGKLLTDDVEINCNYGKCEGSIKRQNSTITFSSYFPSAFIISKLTISSSFIANCLKRALLNYPVNGIK